jgi:uncharacterized membrane protein
LMNAGQLIYSVAMTGLGVLCFVAADFIVGRPPQWSGTPAFNPALAYISGGLIIVASIAILVHKKGYVASLSIAALILLLSVTRHVTFADWLNAYKTLALLGGALILAASFHRNKANLSARSGTSALIWTGSVLLAIFFIACGYAHFKFFDFVKGFIPDYIPFHEFFAGFTAVCLIAGGVGLLIPATRYWAALLSGCMVGGWFLLLHIPRFLSNMQDPSDRMGLFESLAFTGIFFVLAPLIKLPLIDTDTID